ncbi:Ammonium transporter [Parasponia andersonii]|uniref:Ammonium transporter n=1 Tax=Parasponia andersonii TaxID=3476 RepID=A0A2P5CSX2_PARAD|nr:Ammonium transporter [Parasponia andersonii]
MSSIRAKNIILANVVAFAGSLFFYFLGFSFSFGAYFNTDAAHHDSTMMSSFFLSQWTFAVSTAGITNTLLVGRTRFGSHLVFSGGPLGLVVSWLAQSELDSVALRFRVMGQLNTSREALPKMGARAMMVIVGLLVLLFVWFGHNLSCFANSFETYASTTKSR